MPQKSVLLSFPEILGRLASWEVIKIMKARCEPEWETGEINISVVKIT